MARKQYRPGSRLVVFFVGTAVLFGLVAIVGTWKPVLGLDLQGGTRITLIAEDTPKGDSLEQARQIIDQRVNGSGVAEADVTTQGNRFISVEIPGETRRDLIEVVKRTAQLRFRLVASAASGIPASEQPAETPSASPTATPTDKATDEPTSSPTGSPTSSPTSTSSSRPRPAPQFAPAADDPTPSADPTAVPSDLPLPTQTKSTCTGIPTDAASTKDKSRVDLLVAWAEPSGVPQDCQTAFAAYVCPKDGSTLASANDDPARPLIACDADRNKYLLSQAVIEGTQLKSASAGIPQNQVSWAVELTLKGGQARKDFAEVSRKLLANGQSFAIVLDGSVLSTPGFTGVIPDGKAQITGSFTEDSATALANSLKFGALPIKFEKDPTVETIGPSLAGNQLSAGLWAGGIGLILVMLYCLVYYRGLGAVVLASLVLAAAITYAMVLLLSETAGFTLTLPGIAGLVIGVGVTADSFVIFFERIRDEMREGRSMRVAVETGWVRARKTRMAANVVSLLSAGVLYFFATGVVKGFGFALGLSTLIDLAVLFWFTKHAVSWLAQFTFFNGGGELSGLSRSTLGLDAEPQGRTV